MTGRDLRIVVGAAAILFSALYVLSDLMELAAGELYTAQLWVTYLGEAAIPFFVVGLNAVQQPRGGWMSLTGSVLYGAAFVGFSATVLYPLVTGERDPDVVFDDFGAIYDANLGLVAIGGTLFGLSVWRAGVFPRWTGAALLAGLALTALLVGLDAPEGVQTTGTAVRGLAFAGMGAHCLRNAG
jgi:hypothetical protein